MEFTWLSSDIGPSVRRLSFGCFLFKYGSKGKNVAKKDGRASELTSLGSIGQLAAIFTMGKCNYNILNRLRDL